MEKESSSHFGSAQCCRSLTLIGVASDSIPKLISKPLLSPRLARNVLAIGDFAPKIFLVLGLAIILAVSWFGQSAVIFLPAILISVFVFLIVSRIKYGVLYLILSSFVLISGQDEGLQIQELAYGLLYLGFLATWFISRTFYYQDKICDNRIDKAMLVFLILIHLSMPVSFLLGGKLTPMIGDWLAVSMLAFYFPIKEAIKRDPETIKIFGIIFLWLSLFVLFRNILSFRETVLQASVAYEITKGRASMNEIILMASSVGAIVFFLYSKELIVKLASLGFFVLFFIGLILTQSRGYWLGFVFGMGVLFLFASWQKKGQILILAVGGLAGALGIGFMLAPEVMELLVAGIIDRIASLGTASSSDISLVNRFNEFEQVWAGIKRNPILGYGLGHEFTYHNIIYEAHISQAFMHNAYLALWYKYGIVGVGLGLFVWFGSALKGLFLARRLDYSTIPSLLVLSASLVLFCEMMVGNTSNPFVIEDGCLVVAFCMALVSGTETHGTRLPTDTL